MAHATATVGIKNSAFKRGLDSMRSDAKAWAGDLKSTIAGAFAFGAVASFFTNFISSMARVKDLSDRLGQSTDTIQRVGNAAKLSGSDIESVINVLGKLTVEAHKSGEAFARIGISAAEFAAASPEQQVLMLAKAYEEASGNQQKMLDLMSLLGPKGQDILIMLAGGVEELNKQLNQVPVVSETAINAMANLDDAVDSFTQHAHESLGAVIGLLGHLGAAAAAVFQTFSGGSFAENYQKNIEGMLDQKSTAEKPKGGSLVTAEEQKAKAEEQKKAADAIKRLDAEMLALARSRMDAEQKITDLKREQAVAAAAAQDKTKTDAERADSATAVLKLQQEIEAGEKALAKTKADEATKAADKAKKEAEDIAKAESAVADEQKKQALEKMDPKARIAALKAEQKALNDAAAKDPDRKSAAEKKLEALQLNGEIDAAQKELDDSTKVKARNPSVISSSLGAIGGGGGVFVNAGTDPVLQENRRQTSLLQQIARNTSNSGGMPGSPASNPF